MSPRRWLTLLAVLALVGSVLLWRRPTGTPPPSFTGGTETTLPPAGAGAALSPQVREKLLRDSVEAHLADDLNLPGGTIQADMAMVGSTIAAYRSIYHQKGNPIGDNREIVRTLRGGNPNGIIFLGAGHRAINPQGELCDRWGTPFFFHAESGTRMEIRSAGPDRKMWTEDDLAIVP